MKRALVIISTLLVASTATAQKQPTERDSCVRAIPAASLTRVPVFLEASADSASRGILPDADLFTQSVALKMRALLGGGDSGLPAADSAVAWDVMWGEITLVVHRGSAMSWSVPKWSQSADSIPHSALQLIQRAIRDVVADGESATMPESIAFDSVAFGLSLVNPIVTQSGKLIPVKGRQPVPVFTIGVAWSKPVELTRFPHINYPQISLSQLPVGNVRLAFAVDKSGRADVSSVQEIWPPGVTRPKGQLLLAYQNLVLAVKDGLPSARFSPAVIGGCVVRQVVEQKFDFRAQ